MESEHYLIIATDGTVAKITPREMNEIADTHEKWEIMRNKVLKISNPKTLGMIKKLLEE